MSVIMKVYLFNFCVVLCSLVHWGRASFITPCHEEDVKCLKMSAEKALPVLAAGVPEFGIAKMDPMLMDRVKTNQAGLEMDFRNTTVTGLSNCRVLNLKRAGLRTYLDLKCSVDLEGDYTFGGKLLIMPIQGDGKYTTKIRGILVKIQFKVGEKMVNGVKYWTVIDWKHSAEVLKGVHFKYENLFNGNKILSDAVHQFANENWRGIFQEVSPPIVKTIVSQILQQVTKLFDHVPVQELAIE